MVGMQLRHLETFVAIVDCGTFTAAAAQLYKTQGAVSQDLKALESELGLELIDRSGQRVQLTPAGTALLPMARRLLGEVSDVHAEMMRIRAGHRPVVRIACLPSVALLVSRLIAGFRHEHADVRWSLITSLRDAMIDGLRTGKFDLAICEPQNDDDITTVPLVREPLRVVLPDSHPLGRAERLTPADLEDIPYVGFARMMGATIEAQRFFAAGGTYPAPTVEVNDTRLVLDLVSRIDGFGILPASALPDGPPFAVVDTEPPLIRQISLAYLTGRSLPSIAEAFANHLVENWPNGTRSTSVQSIAAPMT